MADTNEYLRAEIKNMDAMFKEGIPATTYDRMFVEGNVYHAVGTISDGYTSASIIGEDIPRNEMVYAEAHKISDVVKPGVPIFNPGRTIGGKVIKLNSEQLRQYKQKLTQAADEVKNIWNTLKNTHVQQLTDSWAGADASAYINNFRSFALSFPDNSSFNLLNETNKFYVGDNNGETRDFSGGSYSNVHVSNEQLETNITFDVVDESKAIFTGDTSSITVSGSQKLSDIIPIF